MAQAIISRRNSFWTGLDYEGLGKDLAQQVFSHLLVVASVFDVLPNYQDKVWVGFYFIKNLPDTGLMKMAQYKEGNALLVAIKDWLYKSPRNLTGNYVKDYKIAQQRIYTARLNAGKAYSYDPKAVRELFDYEIPPHGDRAIRYELPSESDGFATYNRNDELADGLDQIGTYQTIQQIFTLVKAWRAKGTGAVIEIGDISRAGGIDTSAHKTHEDGKAFDMRPLRNDGGSGTPFTWQSVPPYHREWTVEFIKLAKNYYPGIVVYFNDPEVFGRSELRSYVFEVGKGTKEAHDNHLHVIFPGGERTTKDEK